MAKRWYHKRFRMGSDEAKALQEIGRIYGVPVYFRKKKSWCSGFSYGEDAGVIVFLKDPFDGTLENVRSIISTVLHEIGHTLMSRRGKFNYYSNQKSPKDMTSKALRAICRTGFRAECYVEKIGKELIDLHFPGIPFKYGYDWGDAKDRKWLYKHYLKQYGDELKLRRKRT